MSNPSKLAFIMDLDKWINKHPKYKGLNTGNYRDFLIELAGTESSWKKNAKQGSHVGWYQIKNGTLDNQHQLAFDHMLNLFKESITKADIRKAKSMGITLAQLLAKYWNQGNRVTGYLHNGIDDSDGLGTKISQYGNDYKSEIDYLDNVPEALTSDYILATDPKSYSNAVKLTRTPGFDYSDRQATIKKYNPQITDTRKILLLDTIWITPKRINEK